MPSHHSELTHELLTAYLSYDKETGRFIRTCTSNSRDPNHSIDNYQTIKLFGKTYSAHRLAWFYVYGKWPSGEIDHINGKRGDNRICNLRDVTTKENQHNQKKAKGYWKNKKGWTAEICVDQKTIRLGTYATPEEARDAYLKAKTVYHPSAPFPLNQIQR